jgi:CRISPR-associated protein (TIGR03985 family)
MNTFAHSPTPEFLNKLSPFRPSDHKKDQKRNTLRKAIRLWYTLQQLPAFTQQRPQFTDREWRNHLYSDASNDRDSHPKKLDGCISTKTIPQILFETSPQQQNRWEDWGKKLAIYYYPKYGQTEMGDYLKEIQSLLPFDVTGKTILNDMEFLSEIGYLQKLDGTEFKLVEQLNETKSKSSTPSYLPDLDNSIFLAEDFDSYQEYFAAPIRDIQRFYIHADYRSAGQDHSGAVQKRLRQVWEQLKTPPIALKYDSASQGEYHAVVYPLLIHYYQRAFYLCAYAQEGFTAEGWHNYRIDRIQNIEILKWSDVSVTTELAKLSGGDDEEEIFEVQDAWEDAYGCDFYQPSKTMLLRFDRNFHDRYIQKTFRHNTFKEVTPDKIRNLLQDLIQKYDAPVAEMEVALQRFQVHPLDAYYRMTYRTHDHSVLMRLRAWSPNAEVLFPLDLRQRMAADLHQAANFYPQPPAYNTAK